jgi:hypothetical protein
MEPGRDTRGAEGYPMCAVPHMSIVYPPLDLPEILEREHA